MDFIRKHCNDYNFIGNRKNGMTMRWGKTFDDNPFRSPIPELVDISISNHCTKECSFCYRESSDNNKFMSLIDYEKIMQELNDPKWGNVFQVALGGGEPLEHPDFIEILQLTKKYNVIPNFTTNALNITKDIALVIKDLVGAVAVSFQYLQDIANSNANIFINEGIKTNIHFILDKHSIKQGIEILEGIHNELLIGFSSIVFLTYKPKGRGGKELCLELNDDLLQFCKLIDNQKCNLNIGFDSCFMPMLMHYSNTPIEFIEPCECAFFSAYIDEKLNVSPCSFANNNKETYNLKEESFSKIWNKHWESFRQSQVNTCLRDCNMKMHCRGGCQYYSQINLCKITKQKTSLL